MPPPFQNRTEFQTLLGARIKSLLQNPNPENELIRMRLTARPDGTNVDALVDFHILCAVARHIGTNDPLSEANLRGICKKRKEFESILLHAQN
jgi:hypothetical protein